MDNSGLQQASRLFAVEVDLSLCRVYFFMMQSQISYQVHGRERDRQTDREMKHR